ncbi:TPA: hypothetical protein ACKRGU_003265 [Proteus mirabilis]
MARYRSKYKHKHKYQKNPKKEFEPMFNANLLRYGKFVAIWFVAMLILGVILG